MGELIGGHIEWVKTAQKRLTSKRKDSAVFVIKHEEDAERGGTDNEVVRLSPPFSVSSSCLVTVTNMLVLYVTVSVFPFTGPSTF